MRRVVRNNDSPEVAAYKEAHAAEFDRLLRSGEQFNNDTITRVIGKVPPPAHPNLAGALFSGAVKRAGDRIEICGHTQAENEKSNASDVRLYRGVGFEAPQMAVVPSKQVKVASTGRTVTRYPRAVPQPKHLAASERELRRHEKKPRRRGAQSKKEEPVTSRPQLTPEQRAARQEEAQRRADERVQATLAGR